MRFGQQVQPRCSLLSRRLGRYDLNKAARRILAVGRPSEGEGAMGKSGPTSADVCPAAASHGHFPATLLTSDSTSIGVLLARFCKKTTTTVIKTRALSQENQSQDVVGCSSRPARCYGKSPFSEPHLILGAIPLTHDSSSYAVRLCSACPQPFLRSR